MKRIIAVVILCVGIGSAQQKSESIKLNPEASAGVIEAEKDLAIENARHNTEVKRISDLQGAYLKGAGVPKDYQCGWDLRVNQIVTCSKVEAKATPEKK